jgi:Divergent InlB B-repeat domain
VQAPGAPEVRAGGRYENTSVSRGSIVARRRWRPRRRRIVAWAALAAALVALAAGLARADAQMTWSAPATIDPNASLLSVSCVAASPLCVAVDNVGNVVTSTNPSGGAWTVAAADASQNGFFGVSCASTQFCAAVDSGGNVVTSANPTGGAGAWTVTSIDPGNTLTAVSCVTAHFCVAVDSGGNVVTSTSPTSSAWTVTAVDQPGTPLLNVACASTSLCVAVDIAGNVLSSTAPMGGAGAWTTETVVSGVAIDGVSCPSTSLCVAVDESGDVLTSTDPTAASPAWSGATIDAGNAIDSVSCVAGTSSCVAVDNAGNALSSTNPTGGAGAWSLAVASANDVLNGLSCATTALCVAVDFSGSALYGLPPQGSGSSPTGGGSTGASGGSYTLTVEIAGSGKGTVSFAGLGIDCPTACEGTGSGAYSGKAIAASGSHFSGWSGGCGGTGACAVTLGSDETVTATFAAVPKSPTISHERISGSTATFKLAKPAKVKRLQCALVRKASGKHGHTPAPSYSSCADTVTYRRLKKGKYVFYARTVAGGADSRAVSRGFSVT